MDSLIYAMPAMGIVALLYVAWKSAWVSKQEVGSAKMAGNRQEYCGWRNGFLESGVQGFGNICCGCGCIASVLKELMR